MAFMPKLPDGVRDADELGVCKDLESAKVYIALRDVAFNRLMLDVLRNRDTPYGRIDMTINNHFVLMDSSSTAVFSSPDFLCVAAFILSRYV